MEPKPQPQAEVDPDDEIVTVDSRKAFLIATSAFAFGLILGQFMEKNSFKPKFASEFSVDALERRVDRLEAYEYARRELKATS